MRIINVEQGSDEWRKIRLGKVTGTRIKDVLKSDNLGVVDEIISEIISEQSDDLFVNQAMQRGIDYEPIARKAYEKKTGVKIEQTGLIQHDQFDWLVMSPDGIVKSEEVYKHGIEIKCPNTKTHVMTIRMNIVPIQYRMQVLSMFIINKDLETHDFISFDDRFTLKPMHIITTNREDIQEEAIRVEAELIKFWNKVQKYYNQILF